MFKEANPPQDIHRVDALRFLTQNLGQAFDLALETKDTAYPQIHAFVTPYCKLGGDVADFSYRQAWIDGNHIYKITGCKGTARWLYYCTRAKTRYHTRHRLAQPARAFW